MVAEDFSYFQQQVPGLFYFVGITPKDQDMAQGGVESFAAVLHRRVGVAAGGAIARRAGGGFSVAVRQSASEADRTSVSEERAADHRPDRPVGAPGREPFEYVSLELPLRRELVGNERGQVALVAAGGRRGLSRVERQASADFVGEPVACAKRREDDIVEWDRAELPNLV